MDTRASTPELMKLQTSLRFFYDAAAQCNNHCVKTYDTKALNNDERECVTTCFSKQMQIYDSLNRSIGHEEKFQ